MYKKALSLAETAMSLVVVAIVIAAITATFASVTEARKFSTFVDEFNAARKAAVFLMRANDQRINLKSAPYLMPAHMFDGNHHKHVYGGELSGSTTVESGSDAAGEYYRISAVGLPNEACRRAFKFNIPDVYRRSYLIKKDDGGYSETAWTEDSCVDGYNNTIRWVFKL